MTIQEIAEFAAEQTGDISSEALDFAKRAIRLKYATLYDAHNWRESMRIWDAFPLDSTLNGAFFLPADAEEVIFCSLSYDQRFYTRLDYRERDWIERSAPGSISLPGVLPWFYRSENLGWPVVPAGVFTFSSLNQNPFSIYIAGQDAQGFPISETFSLQSPSPGVAGSISTVNSYQIVTTLSKDVCDQPLTILSGAKTIKMSPGQTENIFTQIVLYPSPNFPAWVKIQVKLKPDNLDNDMSVPRISHIWDALICFTTSALWKRLQQVQKAQTDSSDGMEHLKAAVNMEKNQAEWFQQVQPVIYERGDYLPARGVVPSSVNPFGV